MKKILGMMLVLVALSTATFAQKQKANPEKRMENRMKNMKKELNLTDEQAAKVSKLMKDQAKEQKALTEQMKANRKASKAELKSILTQEQYIKLLEKQAERGPRKRQHTRRRGNGVERG